MTPLRSVVIYVALGSNTPAGCTTNENVNLVSHRFTSGQDSEIASAMLPRRRDSLMACAIVTGRITYVD